MPAQDNSIIIKKIKKGGHGYHGGAWKVAYADFVTAMMAFFLLMWLLNATEAENLAGLADYFAPTVGIRGEMGIGFRGGKSALSKGIGADRNTNRGIVFGGVPTGPIMKVTEKFELVTQEAAAEKIKLIMGGDQEIADENIEQDTISMSQAAQALESHIKESLEESASEESVDIVVTPEGLELQIRDPKNRSMFKDKSNELEPRIMDVLFKLSDIIQHMPNYISIAGHTSSVPLVGRVNYGNWELSADRANAVRRFLVGSGIQSEQIARVIGRSDNEPVDLRFPESEVNDRITLVLLRSSISPNHKKSAPDAVFIDPESSAAKDLVSEQDEDIEFDELEGEVEEIIEYKANEEIQGLVTDIESGSTKIPDSEKEITEPKDLFDYGAVPDDVLFSKNKPEVKKIDKNQTTYKENTKMKEAILEIESGEEDVSEEDLYNLQIPAISGAVPDDILFGQ